MSGEVLKVKYEDLDATVAEVNTEKGEIEETLSDLRTRLDQLDWIGADRDAYEETKAKWDASLSRLTSMLEGVTSTVQLAREKYQEAEDGFVTVLSP